MRMAEKQQFNVYLPPALIRRVKHAAIDAEASISEYTERALEEKLERDLAQPNKATAER